MTSRFHRFCSVDPSGTAVSLQPRNTSRRTCSAGSAAWSYSLPTVMWPLGSKAKKQRYALGTAASLTSSDKLSTGCRDDSVVITASAVAPLVPAAAPGLAMGSGIISPTSQLHHIHVLSHAASGGGGGGGAGAGSGSSITQAAAPVGQPYQRIHSSGSGTGASASVDESLARTVLLSSATRRAQLCDEGLPDPDMCDLVEESGPPAAMPVLDEAFSRGRWLLGLLIVQSTSSFVLDAYQDLLRDHLVVTLFLTMLVGAGGNAGNQSAIKVIRGLATGVIRPSWPSARATIRDQALVGLLLGTGLSAGGFVRVYATHGDVANAAAISISLFLIVMTSVVLGTGLPFALARAGVDPANAGTSIQVLMDILGVAITCVTCHFVLVQLAAGVGASVAS